MKSLSTFRILLASFLLVITEQIGGKSFVFEKYLKIFKTTHDVDEVTVRFRIPTLYRVCEMGKRLDSET